MNRGEFVILDIFPPLFRDARNPSGDPVKKRVTDLKQWAVNLRSVPNPTYSPLAEPLSLICMQNPRRSLTFWNARR